MKSLGVYFDMSKYHNVDIWSTDWNILRFMLKNIEHIQQSVIIPRYFTTDR